MPRYIDADLLMPNAEHKGRYDVVSAYDIANTPTADVRENMRGEWERVVSGCAILIRCNQCKNAISENDFFEICRKVNHDSKLLDFCPNCGADMRK